MARHLGSAGTVWRGVLIATVGAILLLAQDDAAKDKAVFAGKVSNSVTGEAVANAAIRLGPVKGEQPGYSGRAGVDGRFRFEAIAPGDYHIEVTARGYTDARTVIMQAGRDSFILHFEPKQSITDASVLLDAEAVVTGRVTDAQGEALPDAGVIAVGAIWWDGIRVFLSRAQAIADGRGEYRLKLTAGKYYLTAGSGGPGGYNYLFSEDVGKPEMRIGAVYYPGAAAIENASPLELRPGQQLGGVDFKLAPVVTYHVRGVLASYVDSPGVKVIYLRSRNGDRVRGIAGGTLNKDGSFDWGAVPPGSYWLDCLPIRGLPTAPLIPIEVTDHDVNGVKVPAIPQFDVRGHARFEDDGVTVPLTSVKLFLQQLDWYFIHYGPFFSLGRDGGFVLPAMQCGEYALRTLPEGDVYVKSVTVGGQPVEGAKIDLRNGAPGEFEIVLGAGTGDAIGTVRWPDAIPGAAQPRVLAARAVLVSADGHTSNTGARSMEIDASGQFQFHFVPPGRWLVFVSPNSDGDLWQNMPFVKELQSRGAAVDLEKKGSAHTEVWPLTAEDIERAIEKVKP